MPLKWVSGVVWSLKMTLLYRSYKFSLVCRCTCTLYSSILYVEECCEFCDLDGVTQDHWIDRTIAFVFCCKMAISCIVSRIKRDIGRNRGFHTTLLMLVDPVRCLALSLFLLNFYEGQGR